MVANYTLPSIASTFTCLNCNVLMELGGLVELSEIVVLLKVLPRLAYVRSAPMHQHDHGPLQYAQVFLVKLHGFVKLPETVFPRLQCTLPSKARAPSLAARSKATTSPCIPMHLHQKIQSSSSSLVFGRLVMLTTDNECDKVIVTLKLRTSRVARTVV